MAEPHQRVRILQFRGLLQQREARLDVVFAVVAVEVETREREHRLVRSHRDGVQILFEDELHRFFAGVAFEVASLELIHAREHQVRQHVAGAACGTQPVGRFAEPVLRQQVRADCGLRCRVVAAREVADQHAGAERFVVCRAALGLFFLLHRALHGAIGRRQIEIDVLQRPFLGAGADQHHEGDLVAAVVHRTDGR